MNKQGINLFTIVEWIFSCHYTRKQNNDKSFFVKFIKNENKNMRKEYITEKEQMKHENQKTTRENENKNIWRKTKNEKKNEKQKKRRMENGKWKNIHENKKIKTLQKMEIV